MHTITLRSEWRGYRILARLCSPAPLFHPQLYIDFGDIHPSGTIRFTLGQNAKLGFVKTCGMNLDELIKLKLRLLKVDRVSSVSNIVLHLHGLSPEWQQTDVWPLPPDGRQGQWPGWFPRVESEFYCGDLWWCLLWSKPHCHLWSLPRKTTSIITWKLQANRDRWRKGQQTCLCLTNGHEVEVLVYTEARHFSWFVSRNCRKDPRAQRVPTVSLVQVPDLHLQNK